MLQIDEAWRARMFLRSGCRSKHTIELGVRDLRRPKNGCEILERTTEDLATVADVEVPSPDRPAERDLTMVRKPVS